jgi:hypothetical protein
MRDGGGDGGCGGASVVTRLFDTVESATLVAVIVTVDVEGIVPGAV